MIFNLAGPIVKVFNI